MILVWGSMASGRNRHLNSSDSWLIYNTGMTNDFAGKLFQKHITTERFPSSYSITRFTNGILEVLFPALSKSRKKYRQLSDLEKDLADLRKELQRVLSRIQHLEGNASEMSSIFFEELPVVYEMLEKDIEALIQGDPAAQNEFEVIRSYPGFYAIAFYRLAHLLYKIGVPLLPRVLTEYAHSRTGIDIHPAAEIAPYFFIDHGTGIVIGETTRIGQHVKLYQGVTLGALSVSKGMAKTKRHPTIEDHVVIYSGATILGGETIIGHHSVIGGNVWITKSIPPYSVAYHVAEVDLRKTEQNPTFSKE